VHALIALSLSLDGGRHASVYRFVRALRRRALGVKPPARSDAVQLMTVHAVKGLEARCVWMVDTDPYERPESQPGVLVDWPVERDAPLRVAFVADLARPCASLADLRAREQAAAQREELNALYVAMTRARDVLLFSRTPASRAAAQASWWSRLQPHSEPFAVPFEAAADVARQAGLITIAELPGAAADTRPAAAQVASMPSPAAQLGRAVHRALQWAMAAAAAPELARFAAAAAAEFELPASAATTVAAYVDAIRSSPALQPFFDATQLTWSADEFDVVYEGRLLRIDRLVQRVEPAAGGPLVTWWVLDYKLAADAAADPELQRQLATYRAAVQALVGTAPVRAAFITGDGRLHELAPS